MEVIELKQVHKKLSIRTLMLAFKNDAFVRWLYPDLNNYLEVMPQLLEVFIDAAIDNNSGWLIDGAGVACWTPPEGKSFTERRFEIHQQYLSKAKLQRLQYFYQRCVTLCPVDPCWYLGIIGVEPTLQGRGIGTALICDRLENIKGMTVGLDTTGQSNKRFYERKGFEVAGAMQLADLETSYVMVRS